MIDQEITTVKPRHGWVLLRAEKIKKMIELPDAKGKNLADYKNFIVDIGEEVKGLSIGDEVLVKADGRITPYCAFGGTFLMCPEECVIGVIKRD